MILTNKIIFLRGMAIGIIVIVLWIFVLFSTINDLLKFSICIFSSLFLAFTSLRAIGRRPMLKTLSIEKQINEILKHRKRGSLLVLGIFFPMFFVFIFLLIQ